MSGIPGFFHRDGRPADAGIVGRMIAAAPHRGPDGGRCWTSGPVAVGHQALRIQAEDGPQPVLHPSRELVVSLDGRLDNRPELIRALCLSHPGGFRTPSDAELVLAAYERWGEDCPVRLLGDFAFVVWDGAARKLFCARDVMGIKPFYYCDVPGTLCWASDVRQILASGFVPSIAPNEGFVAEYLAFAPSSREETFYKHILRLPAAHCLTVTGTSVRTRRYWQLDATAELRYERDEEYAEHLRELFTEAVRCRLPNDSRRAGAYLSGGLDSSSVVAVASSLGWNVETFSLVFPDDATADETSYIDAMTERWQLASRRLPASAVDRTACLQLVERRRDVLDLPSDVIAEGLRARMREAGHRVVLTGIGGDYDFGGSYYHYAELLQERDLVGLGRQLVADFKTADRLREPLQELLMSGVRPLLPKRLRNMLKPLAARAGAMPALPGWVGRRLVERVGLAERLRAPSTSDAAAPARRHMLDLFGAGWTALILERVERYSSEQGIEERHPFFDRRVIEFALAIPERQRWRGEETKFVLRRALADLLPAPVLRRTDKADFSMAVPVAVEALGGRELLDRLQIASLGWVDQAQISEKYGEAQKLFACDAEWYCREMFHLWMTATIEVWYRTMFSGAHVYDGTSETAGLEPDAWAGQAGSPGAPQSVSVSGAR